MGNLRYFYDKHATAIEGAVLLEEWLKELICIMHAKVMVQEIVGEASREKSKDLEIEEAVHRLKTYACYKVEHEEESVEEGGEDKENSLQFYM